MVKREVNIVEREVVALVAPVIMAIEAKEELEEIEEVEEEIEEAIIMVATDKEVIDNNIELLTQSNSISKKEGNNER